MTALPKPPYGHPCNGCGLCCLAQQCPLSLALFEQADRCPALVENDHGFACGLIVDTAAHVPDLPSWGRPVLSEAFGLMLGAGLGCDGQVEGEDVPIVHRLRMRALASQALNRASPEAQELVRSFTAPDLTEAA